MKTALKPLSVKVTLDADDLRAVLELAMAALGASMPDVVMMPRDLDAMDRVTDALDCVRRQQRTMKGQELP